MQSHFNAGHYLRLALTVVAIALGAWTMGEPTRYWNTSSLNYDDSEYVYQALDTAAKIDEQGLAVWPHLVYWEQHYGKPPLLVNSLTASIQVTGIDHAFDGVQLTMVASTALLLGAIAWTFYAAYGAAGALIAVLAVLAMPAFVSWAPRVIPEIQLAFLAFAGIALLTTAVRGPLSLAASIVLGAAWGLGMHAKATFPLYVAGPVLFWLLYDRSLRRTLSLLPALFVAAPITALWYTKNFDEAVQYVRGAAGFVDDPTISRGTRLGQWVDTLTLESLGWMLLVLVVVAIGAWLRRDRTATRGPSSHTLLTGALLSSALPMLLISLASAAPPNTRHPLPSTIMLVLITVALLVRYQRKTFVAIGTAVLVAQAALMLLEVQRAPLPLQQREGPLTATLEVLAPGLLKLQAIDDTLPEGAYASVAAKLGDTPAVVYLAGHDGALHVPKLNLLAMLDRNSVRFDYATYFSWTPEFCRDRIANLLANSAPILLLQNREADRDGASRYFYRHQALGQSLLNDGHPQGYATQTLADTATRKLELLMSNDDLAVADVPRQAVGVRFGNSLTIEAAGRGDGFIVVAIRAEARVDRNYKLMVHASIAGEPDRAFNLDQNINPPLRMWRAGNRRDIVVTLPPDLARRDAKVDLGFFDESDAEHGWPRLRAADATDLVSVELPAPRDAASSQDTSER